MEYRNYRIKPPVKSFRDLEVYQKTIQLSDEITSLPFLNKDGFEQDNRQIKEIAESIPKLIAEAYGDKFDSTELANKKLTDFRGTKNVKRFLVHWKTSMASEVKY